MERSHRLLKGGGRFGVVTSNKFIRSKYGKNLRKYLETDVQICQIIDFGDLPDHRGAGNRIIAGYRWHGKK